MTDKEKLDKIAEKRGMTLTEYLEFISPLNNKESCKPESEDKE